MSMFACPDPLPLFTLGLSLSASDSLERVQIFPSIFRDTLPYSEQSVNV